MKCGRDKKSHVVLSFRPSYRGMAEFEEKVGKMPGGVEEADVGKLSLEERTEPARIDYSKPVVVKYSPISGLPAEFCEYSATFKKELPWLRENAPEVLSAEQLEGGEESGAAGGGGEEMSKRAAKNAVGAKIAKESTKENKVRVIIAKIQRQKRKFVTAVAGMDTIPGLKLKDAAKLFGKKFASGAAVSDTPSGGKEIVIQGDVNFDLVPLIIKEYKVSASDIYFLEDGKLYPQG